MSDYEYDFGEGLKQYKAIIDGGEADFVPVTTQMAEFCMKYGGHNGHDFFRDPELFVRGSLDVQREMGFHVPDMVWDVYSVEAEALGGQMAWSMSSTPLSTTPKSSSPTKRIWPAPKRPIPCDQDACLGSWKSCKFARS